MPQLYWIPKLHKTPYKARFIAGSYSCTTTKLSKLITDCLKLVKYHCTAYCKTILGRTGVNSMWIINNALDVLRTLQQKQLSLDKISTWDFSTLYTSLPHTKLKLQLHDLLERVFTTRGKGFLEPITITLSGRMIRSLQSTLTFLAENFASLLTFLSKTSTSVSETQFFDKLLEYQWALTVRLYWLICFSTLSSTITCSKL